MSTFIKACQTPLASSLCWDCDCPRDILYSRIMNGDFVPPRKDGVIFTADLHIGSELMAKLRGFDNVVDHDEYIVSTLEKQSSKRTLLWVLGDVAMETWHLYKLRTRFLGTMKLVLGNHDSLAPSAYAEAFQEVHGFTKYKKMWLSHCPIHPNEFYLKKLNVHGHVHAVDKQTGETKDFLKLPYVNVNWDLWGRAVTLTELRSVMPGGYK